MRITIQALHCCMREPGECTTCIRGPEKDFDKDIWHILIAKIRMDVFPVQPFRGNPQSVEVALMIFQSHTFARSSRSLSSPVSLQILNSLRFIVSQKIPMDEYINLKAAKIILVEFHQKLTGKSP